MRVIMHLFKFPGELETRVPAAEEGVVRSVQVYFW